MRRAFLAVLFAWSLPPLLADPDVEIQPGGVPGSGTVGTPYSGSIRARRGREPYVFSIAVGVLPSGLTLSQAGDISGVPLQAGAFPFTARVADADGDSATRSFSIVIAPSLNPPSITTTSPLPNGTVGTSYSLTLTATGGTPPYRWSGAAPAGLAISSSGALTGTPNAPGNYSFTVTVTDNLSRTATRSLAITIDAPPLAITTTALPPAQPGVAYSYQLAASGGIAPLTWALTSGDLPPGLTLGASSGVIAGIATGAGSSFTLRVSDSAGRSASRQFSIAVDQALTLSNSPPLTGGTLGIAYTRPLFASGGRPPYDWSITSGSLPPGLTLAPSTGIVNGVPTAVGSFGFTARVRDSAGAVQSAPYVLVIARALTITTAPALPPATAGAAYSTPIAIDGGTAPFIFALAGGTLPSGITLNGATGELTGTAAIVGQSAFTVRVSDTAGAAASRAFTLTVSAAAPAAISMGPLPAVTQAAQQLTLDLSIAAPQTFPVSATARLIFTPDTGLSDDAAVQFASGGRSVGFTIPASQTRPAAAIALQTGSVAGVIEVRITMAGAETPAIVRTMRVARSAPAIRSLTMTRTATGFTLQLTGLATTRELTRAQVKFTIGGAQPVEFAVPLADTARGWYLSAASAAYGSQFSLTLPFTAQGDAGGIQSAAVTLVNAEGESGSMSAPMR